MYTPESWEYSRGYASVFGTVPSSFTSVTRSLVSESVTPAWSICGTKKYFVLRLLKSKTVLAPFVYAYKGLNADPKGSGPITPQDVLTFFGPDEVSYVFGLTYLFRRARQLCAEDQWQYIEAPLMANLSAGFLIGRAIPSIGATSGMIEGSIRFLGLASFLRHDPKGYKEYRRDLKKANLDYSDDLEAPRWGCTSLQIGSVLLQTLGFGVLRANALVNAFSSRADTGSEVEVRFTRDFRMAQVWRALLQAGELDPKFALPAQYYPKRQDIQVALDLFAKMKEDYTLLHWLARSKDDLDDLEVEVPTPTASTPDEESADQLADQVAQELEGE